MSNVASGQQQGHEIILVIRDQYGQVVKTDTFSKATLLGNANISLGGTTVVTANEGVYIFNDFSVTAAPGTNSSFRISTDGI